MARGGSGVDGLQSFAHKPPVLQVFALADTSYNSEGVDEVAAQHIDGDCVVRTAVLPTCCRTLHIDALATQP